MVHSTLVILTVFAALTQGYHISVEPGAIECFFNRFNKDEYISITYEVHSGGYLDIGFSLTDAKNESLHDAIKTHEKMLIRADGTGVYQICFNNKRDVSQQIKEIIFFFDIDPARSFDVSKPVAGNSTDEERLEGMIRDLSSGLERVKQRNSLLEYRQRYHVMLSHNIDAKVIVWGIFQCAFAALGSWCQAYFTQRFFEVRHCV